MLVTQQPVLRKFWYAIVPIEKLDDGPFPFTLLGENIVLWKDADGNPCAIRDRCCHRTAKLSKGFVDDGNIVCGYHGWTYDKTGACVRIPQLDGDQAKLDKKQKLLLSLTPRLKKTVEDFEKKPKEEKAEMMSEATTDFSWKYFEEPVERKKRAEKAKKAKESKEDEEIIKQAKIAKR